MKPAPFEYHDPRSVAEALELLGRHGAEARLLAGGQSLVPRLNFRLATPAVIVDLNRIPELSFVRQSNGHLAFGAMTRQRAIQFSGVVADKIPLLVEAARFIGHLPTRTRGTIGGSLAHADPAAELPTLVTALDGAMVVRGPSGERILRPADFFDSAFTTTLRADEMLVEVRLPIMPPASGFAFEELSLRENHFALVAVAAQVTIDRDRRCTAARIGVGGCPRPVRLRAVEEMLEQGGLGEQTLKDAAARAAELVDPLSDIHASADYRRRLTRVLVGRALARAISRADETEATGG